MEKCHGECCVNCAYSRPIPFPEFPENIRKLLPSWWWRTELFCFAAADSNKTPVPTYTNQYSCVNGYGRWTDCTCYNTRLAFMTATERSNEFYWSEESKPKIRIVVGEYDIHLHALLLVVEIQDLRQIAVLASYDPIAYHEEWDVRLSKHGLDLNPLTRDGLWESERLATMTDREIAQEHVARCKAFLRSWYNR